MSHRANTDNLNTSQRLAFAVNREAANLVEPDTGQDKRGILLCAPRSYAVSQNLFIMHATATFVKPQS
jgi:hypothetical protein